jgi:transcriptional regulator with XRE-family HTH domain
MTEETTGISRQSVSGKDLEDSIAGRLILLREKNGLTKSKFASMCGYSAMMQTKYERAENTPSYDMLKVIARTFDCDFEWLKYGKGRRKGSGTEMPSGRAEQQREGAGDIELKSPETENTVQTETGLIHGDLEAAGKERTSLRSEAERLAQEHAEKERTEGKSGSPFSSDGADTNAPGFEGALSYLSDPAETGGRLKKIREEKGMTQKEFAEKAGLSPRRYLDIENGKTKITVKSLKKLEESYGVGREYLLYGHEQSRNFPLTDEMIRYLQKSEKIREMVWREMRKEQSGFS